VLIDRGDGHREPFEVRGARAYRDKLVLLLAGIEDAGDAARLRGGTVLVPPDQVPELPDGRYYLARLLGLEVWEETGVRVGRVSDVIEAGGTETLVVEDEAGHEILVPLVREIVLQVRQGEGRITVRLPEGLRELNR